MTAEDYRRLHDALRTAADFCWPLESFWIIETPRTPSQVIQFLLNQGVLDDNDGMVVLEITGTGAFRARITIWRTIRKVFPDLEPPNNMM